MFIYTVTVTIKKDIEEEWVSWMNDVHLDQVMAAGYFSYRKLYKILIPSQTGDEVSFVVHYFTESLELYEEYAKKEASRLQAEHTKKFPGKFKAARSVMMEVI